MFSPDYATARQQFRQAASRLGWQLEQYPVGGTGPAGEQLTLDVASSSNRYAQGVLVISSGVHGVEGFFGSAVQAGLLEERSAHTGPPVKCVFLHALNPYGFAWLRRANEDNVDLNRNFLLPAERYEGCPEKYAVLDPILNPQRPPSRWEPFTFKALWTIARHGMPALRQSIATGQYRFPRGMFFGGTGPSRTHQILAENLPRWLHGGRDVVHLDFHTGLGVHGTCKLLIDYPLSDRQRTRLTEWFGADSFETVASNKTAYPARGGLGQWCVGRQFAAEYLFACVEFGTYGPFPMLKALRAENQAHHWGTPDADSTIRAKRRLKELFCPSEVSWRTKALKQSFDLVARAMAGLAGVRTS
jgi:hypothetical protein